MNKTIGEAAMRYAETHRIPSCPITIREKVNQNHLQNAFIDGAAHVLSLPLAERLREEEKKKVKAFYNGDTFGELDFIEVVSCRRILKCNRQDFI